MVKRLILVGNAIVFLVLGLAFLLVPEKMTGVGGMILGTPTAKADIRAVYGGIQIGLAVFLFLCVRSAERAQSGLLAATCVLTGLGLARSYGMIVDGAMNPESFRLLFPEVVGSILTFWAFLRKAPAGVAALILLFAANAQAMTFSDERGHVEVPAPAEWKYAKNLFGIPHVLLGPEKRPERRSVLGVTLTGREFDVSAPQKGTDQYKEGRKAWAKKRNVVPLKFESYRALKTASGVSIHAVGWSYRIGKKEALNERSYFLECPSSLVHLKAIALTSRKGDIEAMEKMALGTECGKGISPSPSS